MPSHTNRGFARQTVLVPGVAGDMEAGLKRCPVWDPAAGVATGWSAIYQLAYQLAVQETHASRPKRYAVPSRN